VLEGPEARFYDISSGAEVAYKEVNQHGVSLILVVVFRRRDDVCHIVTAYPIKDVKDEIERKVKIGRWIPI